MGLLADRPPLPLARQSVQLKQDRRVHGRHPHPTRGEHARRGLMQRRHGELHPLDHPHVLVRGKYADKPPFTLLSSTGDIEVLYSNANQNAHWRQMRRASRSWRMRDKKLLEVFQPDPQDDPSLLWRNYDIDPNATIVVLTDNIHPKKDRLDTAPFGMFMSALARHLSSSLPSLAIRTGMSQKVPIRAGARVFSASRASAPRVARPCSCSMCTRTPCRA